VTTRDVEGLHCNQGSPRYSNGIPIRRRPTAFAASEPSEGSVIDGGGRCTLYGQLARKWQPAAGKRFGETRPRVLSNGALLRSAVALPDAPRSPSWMRRNYTHAPACQNLIGPGLLFVGPLHWLASSLSRFHLFFQVCLPRPSSFSSTA
jgi:hypothetical protein